MKEKCTGALCSTAFHEDCDDFKVIGRIDLTKNELFLLN
jgi:hypothetical protein